MKNNARKWFYEGIAEDIHKRNKLYKKFNLTKLHVDEDIYREAQNAIQNLFRKKKKAYFEEKLKAATANPKNLWETLKKVDMQNIKSPFPDICLKKRERV